MDPITPPATYRARKSPRPRYSCTVDASAGSNIASFSSQLTAYPVHKKRQHVDKQVLRLPVTERVSQYTKSHRLARDEHHVVVEQQPQGRNMPEKEDRKACQGDASDRGDRHW